jgi:hypothetical protein
MALINKIGITNGGTIEAEHITRALDALSGGSTDSVSITGSLMGSSSYALTASYALNGGGGVASETASYALTASKILVSDNTSLTGPQPIMLATGTGATRLVATDTADFSFNPIGNLLTVAKISGDSTNTSASVTMTASNASYATTALGIAATSNIPVSPTNGTFFMGNNEPEILWVYNDGDWYSFTGTPGTPTP